MGPGLKVAHRGAPWAAFAEAPVLPTPPGSASVEFDTPGVKAPNLALSLSTRAHPRRGVLLGEMVIGFVRVRGCLGEMKLGPVGHPQDREILLGRNLTIFDQF